MKILVIEDQPAELKLVHHVLSDAGHHVNCAADAVEAFALIAEDRPEVILMDMGLPGMDGLSVVQKLKGDPETRDIHIVTVTSYTETYSRAEAMAAGVDAYLMKPLSTRTLADEISAVVAAKRRDEAKK